MNPSTVQNPSISGGVRTLDDNSDKRDDFCTDFYALMRVTFEESQGLQIVQPCRRLDACIVARAVSSKTEASPRKKVELQIHPKLEIEAACNQNTHVSKSVFAYSCLLASTSTLLGCIDG